MLKKPENIKQMMLLLDMVNYLRKLLIGLTVLTKPFREIIPSQGMNGNGFSQIAFEREGQQVLQTVHITFR
jgi:hypothetical protein